MPIEWAIILVVAVSDAILLAETSFRLEAFAELRILAGSIVLAVVLVICRRWRRWMLLRTSPIRCFSDSIVTDGSEMIRCEGRQDFSMSMID